MSESTARVALAADAYVYGFPLVFDLTEVAQFTTTGFSALPPADLNTFSHAWELAGPSDRFVSVNNDTLYSIASLDLSGGPVRLHVPDTAGDYYVLQFVDAWTNNFAYVGRRATGTHAADYVITPPGWSGATPPDATRIEAPTAIVSIVGRWACNGPDDLPRVHRLQEQLMLEPLGDNGSGLPEVNVDGQADHEAFYHRLQAWMDAFPPSAADTAYQDRFRPLRSAEGAVLEEGMAVGRRRIEEAAKGGLAEAANGWFMLVHAFDYNLDHLGPGTIDSPHWQIADRERSYLARAVAARVGLWGNHAYEAAYATVATDSDGETLTGQRAYAVRFDQPPPVDAFWSLTMYDVPDYFLVDNPIDRYSIGDRTPGLRTAEDGSLTVLMQREEPEEDAENWLPAPEGEFRPMLRLYQPRDEVFAGGYELPAVKRMP